MTKITTTICAICGVGFTHPLSHVKSKFCSDTCRGIGNISKCEKYKRQSVEKFLQVLLIGSKQRAKRKGIPHTLTFEQVLSKLEEQSSCCIKTGIKFTTERRDTSGGKNPWSPSLDRIDNTLGYTKENVQLTCVMYNLCKHTFLEEDVKDFATQLLATQNKE